MEEAEYRRLIAENIKRKERIRALESQLSQLQADYDQLQQDHEELETEADQWIAEEEARRSNPDKEVPASIMDELKTYRSKAKLDAVQKAVESSGKFRKGINAEQILKLYGLDLDQTELDQIGPEFSESLLQWAQSDASFLLGGDEPVAPAASSNETNGRSSIAPTLRRLPTFASSATGGGAAPPPTDLPTQATALRDPAAAFARAAAARANRA